jgi:hypothetical protein
MVEEYRIQNIRRLLINGFDEQGLKQFCRYNPRFRPMYLSLSEVNSLTEVADILIDFAEREGLLGTLLGWAQEDNPVEYTTYQPYFAVEGPQLKNDIDVKLRRALSKPDYSTRIRSIIRANPIGKSHAALAAIAFNIEESAGIRIRALQECIPLGDIESEKWIELLQEPSAELLAGVISVLTNSNVDLTKDQIHMLLTNPQLPRKTSGLGEMVAQLVRRTNYTSAIFLPAASREAWEVRLDCIKTIIELDDEKSLETLFTFVKTTRYWIARRHITKYLLRHASEGRLSSEDKEMAEQILTQIITDGKTDPDSGTMRRAKEALEIVQSYDLVKGIQIVKRKDKIRILFLAANPTNTARLRLDEESRAIDQALRRAEFRDKFDIRQQWAVRVSDIQELLLRRKPDIVHFSGHGSTSSEIILEDNSGNSSPVSVRALSRLFSVLKDNIKCVVLNACYSEQQARAISQSIDCVVGMSKAIGDEAAIGFATAFYQALAFGRDVKTAFELGCIQIDLEGLNEQDTPKLLTVKSDPKNIVFVT